jgi:hypothetical protein
MGGAGDGIRTRDNLLGRQGLCQLSYSRNIMSTNPISLWHLRYIITAGIWAINQINILVLLKVYLSLDEKPVLATGMD